MYVFQTLNTWKIIHWAVYDNISNKSMSNNAQDTLAMSNPLLISELCSLYSVQTGRFPVDIAQCPVIFHFPSELDMGQRGIRGEITWGKGN